MQVKPAYQGELMLAGWSQSHNSGAKVTFMLPDEEALEAFRYLTVKKGNVAGQRFMAVLVQIGDDEEPIEPGSDSAPRKHMTPSNYAALMCESEGFQSFVQNKRNFVPATPAAKAEQAAQYMREFCNMSSRSMLDSVESARQRYKLLMAELREFHGGGSDRYQDQF